MATKKRYRRKKNRQSRTLLLSVLMLVLLGGAVLIYQMIFSKAESTVSMDVTPISTASTYINTGDGLLYQTDGQIHFYHLKDSKQNYTYGMGASDIRMSGSESMTVVFNSISLQVVGKNQPLSFAGAIEEVECGSGHLGVLLRADDGSESVNVITPDGKQVEQMSFADQYIVDFGFYTVSTEMLWVETVNVNSSTPTITITTYDIGKNVTSGMMHIQNQLVDNLYMTESSVFVSGTNQIIRYTHEGNKEIYRYTIYGYKTVDFSSAGDAPTFLLTPRGGDFHSVKILSLTETPAPDEVETYLQLPTEGVAAFIMGSKLVVASRETLYTYTLKGKLSSEATFEQPIDGAVKLNDTVLLLSSNGIYYLAEV